MKENQKPPFIGVIVFCTAPFAFAYQISKGADFSQNFKIYLCVILVAWVMTRLIGVITKAIQKKHKISFKKPPSLPEWTGLLAGAMALTIALIAGKMDGFKTGMIIFWPGGFLSMGIIYVAHWIIWQAKHIELQSFSIRRIIGL